MKRILSVIAVSAALWATAANAQTPSQPAESAEDDTLDYAYELIATGLLINETCKPILEPKFYEGFKVLFRIDIGIMGGDDNDVKEAEEDAVSSSGYLCDGKAECWRSLIDLPATATVEEGKKKCFDTLTQILTEFDTVMTPEKNTSG
ncbi:hypothetical protein [Asticcacaulis sp. 201]|uniref:hypothetical protein n=1 Tax=Asticcacaulis sp. 201 TaxID=3028787 RepID=UPI0029164C1D|nr:hypothetical protein [Asticcacaulis sp. 201]MDV6329965.1 hypothetical protein [Asticcacaulis sp. 201]